MLSGADKSGSIELSFVESDTVNHIQMEQQRDRHKASANLMISLDAMMLLEINPYAQAFR